jgi:glycolate oxidase FAD binding subunit
MRAAPQDMTSTILKPASAEQLRDAIAWAAAEEATLEIVGGGSKRGFGRPLQASHTLDLSALSGVVSYEPAELVLTARAGTTMREIEALLQRNRQILAFEPPDLAAFYGGADDATIGGAVACNLAGPRRIKAGAARDHFLGMSGVSGRGEAFKAGGKVVKNVTGYDLCKLLAGSFGTLAAMDEVTLKVLPAPDKARTVLVFGLDSAKAAAAMADALNSPFEVSAAAHLPLPIAARSACAYVRNAGAAVTALRVEGTGVSVASRCEGLRRRLVDYGALEELHSMNSATLWREVRDVAALLPDAGQVIWRVSVAPSEGPRVAAAIAGARQAELYYDWGGGLLWIATDAAEDGGAAAIRDTVAASGGHATLMRAPDALRAAVPVFEPQPGALGALAARVKDSFDPRRILNPGRMVAGV